MRLWRTPPIALVLIALMAGAVTSSAVAQAPAKQVRLPLPRYDGTLTPYSFELAYPLVTLVYDTLLWRDSAGVARPWLARSVRRSADGRVLRIRLREGLRWHDGRPLTAADVAFTFDFVARRFHPRFTAQLSNVEQVRATGPRTVKITLRHPSLGFNDQPLADLPILPKHVWQRLPESRLAPRGLAIGSGPYRLVEAGRRAGYRFRANRDYFKGRPRVDEIKVPIIRQEAPTYAALRRRKVDMLPVALPEAAARRLGGASGITVQRGPSYSGTALLLNLRRSPFDRRSARKAVARALDLGRIVRNVGPGAPADRGYLHPASPWSPTARLHRFEQAAARRAFSKLGLPPIRVLAPASDPVRLEAGRQVVLALRRAGTKAELVDVSRASLGRSIGEDGSPSDFEAAIVSIPTLASYDPDFLQRLFGSEQRGSPLNYAGYRSRAFDAAAERVSAAPDPPARRRAVGAELALLARDLPAVPLFFSEGRFAYRPAIYDGWGFVKGAGILDKRSFLAGAKPASGPSPAGDAEETNQTGGLLDALSIASLAVLAIALVLGGVALVARLRPRKG